MSELPENWREDLPEDMRSNGILDTVKTMDSLVKMAIDGRTLATTAIRIPSQDADEETRANFKKDLVQKVPDLMFKPNMDDPASFKETMKGMGMPEDVSGYTLPEIPDAIKDNVGALTEKAYEAGLTNNQLNAITEGIVNDFNESADKTYGAMEAQKNELKKEWGEAYDQKVNNISHFAKQTGFSEEFVGAIKEGHIDMENMKAFETVLDGYTGGAIEIGRQANNPAVVMTPQEADKRLNELMGNRDHAYWHPEDPDHQAAKDKVLELGKLAETGEMSDVDKFRQSLLGNG